ncbi:hypothetical protein ACFV4N_24770 [Actinosynnema sp. NPDC059797]
MRTTSRNRALPVSALGLVAVPGGGARVAIRWRRQDDAEVVVRRAERLCAWEFGEVVPLSEMTAYGQEVTGDVDDEGQSRTLTAEVPTGHSWYVPFTLGPSGAVRGQEGSLGIALPVTGLRHQRFGDTCTLSWEWPETVGTAEVEWTGTTGRGKRHLTRQQYLSGGGCRIDCGPGELRVRVVGVVSSGGDECRSAASTLVVPERLPRIAYSVRLARRPLVGGGTVRVRLAAEEPIARCAVLVVVAPGPVMPRRPGDGQVVLRGEQALRPEDGTELVAELPRLRKPYWIRCFLEDEGAALLVDPPTKQLKVS